MRDLLRCLNSQESAWRTLACEWQSAACEVVLGLTGRDLRYEPFLTFAVGVRAGLSHGSRVRDLLRCLNSQEVAWRTLACEWSFAACEVVLGLTGRDLRYEPFLTFAVGVRAGLSHGSRVRDLLRCLNSQEVAWRTLACEWSFAACEVVLGLTGRDLRYEPFLTFAVGVRAGLSHGSRVRDLLRCLNSQEVAWRTLACEWSFAACEVVLGLTGRDLRYEPFLTFAVGVRAGLSHGSRVRDLLRCLNSQESAWRTLACEWQSAACEVVLGLTGRDLRYEPFLTFAVGVRAGLSHGSRVRDLLRCLNSREVAWRTLACEWSFASCEVVLGLTGRDLRYEPFLTFAVGVRAGLSHGSRVRDLLRCLNSQEVAWRTLACEWSFAACEVVLGLTGRDLRYEPFLTFAVGVRAGQSHGSRVSDLLRCLNSEEVAWRTLACEWSFAACEVVLGLTGRDLRYEPFLTFAVGVRAGLSHGSRVRDLLRCLNSQEVAWRTLACEWSF